MGKLELRDLVRPAKLCESDLGAVLVQVINTVYGSVDIAEEISAWCRVMPTHRCMDLACGQGAITNVIARDGAWAIGVDLNGPHLELANREAAKWRVPARYVQHDLESVDFRLFAHAHRNSIDLVTCCFSVAYLKDIWRLGQAVRSMLAPGGRFVMVSYGPGDTDAVHNLQRRVCPEYVPDVSEPEFDSLEFKLRPITEANGGGLFVTRKGLVHNDVSYPRTSDFMKYYSSSTPCQETKKVVPDIEQRMAGAVEAQIETYGKFVVTKVVELWEMVREEDA